MDDISRYRKDIQWKSYKALHGNAGIARYAFGDDFILIVFQQGREVYVYNDQVSGKSNIEKMKKLADEGKGLSGFISRSRELDYAVTILSNCSIESVA